MVDNLKDILRSWFVGNERFEEKFGFLGMIVSGAYVVETGDGRVWVTLDDGTVIKAINKQVARKPGLRVIVKPNRDGEMEIAGLQSAQTMASVGNNAYASSNLETPPHQHFIGSGLEDPVESRRFMPGLVHALSGVTVKIIGFKHDNTTYPDDTYDLSGFLPITSGYWAWVKVGVDPATNTKIALTGTEYPSKLSLTTAALDAIDFATPGYIPLAGIKLQEGQTTGPLEVDFAEAREWLKIGSSGGVSSVTATRPIISSGGATPNITMDAQPLLRAFMGI